MVPLLIYPLLFACLNKLIFNQFSTCWYISSSVSSIPLIVVMLSLSCPTNEFHCNHIWKQGSIFFFTVFYTTVLSFLPYVFLLMRLVLLFCWYSTPTKIPFTPNYLLNCNTCLLQVKRVIWMKESWRSGQSRFIFVKDAFAR